MTTIRKNQFEEIIDKMMIDEVSGLDNEIRETLEGLDVYKKRMAILSILDKDRDMFMKIKRIVDDTCVTKVEHIKNVVEMLREYVEVGEREQKEYGEVFTRYNTITEMLSLIPEEDWSNPNLKFLDPCAGAGNFPAVIIEKLMVGLKDVFPNEEDRYTHIVENMIYMSELQARNSFLCLCAFDPRDEYELNIFNGSFLSEEFDNHCKTVWGVDNFDYVIQNPPYQELIEGNNRMRTLYNVFINKALNITDKLISIHPSRWMAGGFGLDEFRKQMFQRTDIKVIKHWKNSQDVFGKVVDIMGGVQYLFIDKNYNGLCEYNGVKCVLNSFDIFVEPKFHKLLYKFINLPSLKDICKSQSYYGFPGNESLFTKEPYSDSIKVYVSKNKGLEMFVNRNLVKKNISGYKVFTPAANGNKLEFGNKIIGLPNEVCSKSYMSFFINTKEEAESLISYMDTKFSHFFLALRKITQNMKPDTMKWIPLVPFDRIWTDDMLFGYFDLTDEEMELILNK